MFQKVTQFPEITNKNVLATMSKIQPFNMKNEDSYFNNFP